MPHEYCMYVNISHFMTHQIENKKWNEKCRNGSTISQPAPALEHELGHRIQSVWLNIFTKSSK